MAIMKMDISVCKSDGERIVYQFLKNNLSDEYSVWSNVELLFTEGDSVQETEIDCIIQHEDIGLMLFEIKDWRVEHIKGISSGWIYLVNGKKFRNPYTKIKNHSYILMDLLKRHNEFLDEYGRVPTPINVAVILPFISQEEWVGMLENFNIFHPDDVRLPSSKVIFKGDCVSKNENSIKAKLMNLRAIKFDAAFNRLQLDYLDQILGVPGNEILAPVSLLKEGFYTLEDNAQLAKLALEQRVIENTSLKEKYNSPVRLVIASIVMSISKVFHDLRGVATKRAA